MRLMRALLLLVPALLASALLGCTPGGASTGSATPSAPTYADRWQFPAEVAGFQRGEVKQTGSGDARRSIAEYHLDTPPARIAITVSVYRPPAVDIPAGTPPIDVAERQFVAEKAAILKAHGLDVPVPPSTPGSITAAGREHPGLVAKFAFDEPLAGKMTEVDSHIYYFLEGEWAVKYGVSFPSATRAASEERIAAFMAALAWP